MINCIYLLRYFHKKYGQPIEPILDTVEEISKLHPAFCSVTYGANGGASENTVKVASYIKNELNTPALAHLTCVGSSKDNIDEKLVQLKETIYKTYLLLGEI